MASSSCARTGARRNSSTGSLANGASDGISAFDVNRRYLKSGEPGSSLVVIGLGDGAGEGSSGAAGASLLGRVASSGAGGHPGYASGAVCVSWGQPGAGDGAHDGAAVGSSGAGSG